MYTVDSESQPNVKPEIFSRAFADTPDAASREWPSLATTPQGRDARAPSLAHRTSRTRSSRPTPPRVGPTARVATPSPSLRAHAHWLYEGSGSLDSRPAPAARACPPDGATPLRDRPPSRSVILKKSHLFWRRDAASDMFSPPRSSARMTSVVVDRVQQLARRLLRPPLRRRGSVGRAARRRP